MNAAIAILLALTSQLTVPAEDEASSQPAETEVSKKKRHLPNVSPVCDGAEFFGGTTIERSAFCATRRKEYVSARTLANEALNQNERSIRAHYLMGETQHLGEGNLPKALFHLEEAERLFLEKYGAFPEPGPEFRVFQRIMAELVWVHGEMDHHEEKIRYVDLLDRRLKLDYQPLKAWPLLKLKRFEEARAVAKLASESPDEWPRAVGLTALCAVESEQRNREAAYEACTNAARRVERSAIDGAIELSNAGAASEEMFRFDEAERYYRESASRPPEGSVNPWGRLVRLYLRQGRFAEAISAWREMRRYRASRPGSYLDQQDQSEADLIGATVLMIAGKIEEAERITGRTVNRPDRQGTSSAASEQNEAGAAITDRVAKRALARRLREDASAAKWKDKIALHLRALELDIDAWAISRTAAEVLADRERLVASLRPEVPGSLELSTWLDAEVIHIVGPGIAMAALVEARAEETLPDRLANQIFLPLEAEAHWLAGEEEEALDKVKQALEILPPSEAMLRARVAAVGYAVAEDEGELDLALGYLRLMLATDPQVVRRMGLRLPVKISASTTDDGVVEAIDMLEDSPLFEEAEWGFELVVAADQVHLVGPDGSVENSIFVPAGRKDDPEAIGRRIVKAVHKDLLVPNVDITQADIRSLDGSLGTGGKASDRVDSILDEVSK